MELAFLIAALIAVVSFYVFASFHLSFIFPQWILDGFLFCMVFLLFGQIFKDNPTDDKLKSGQDAPKVLVTK